MKTIDISLRFGIFENNYGYARCTVITLKITGDIENNWI
jgi:hypothetical protein